VSPKPPKSSSEKRAKATSPAKATSRAKPASRARSAAAKASQPTHDAIADRAYEISLTEPTGDTLSDWLKAEQELTP
jgi:hypothetical protein